MILDGIFERFVEDSPVTVMARLALQRALEPQWVDALFEEHSDRQYTRELLFSSVIDLMSLVAVGMRPSIHAAAKATRIYPRRSRRCTTRSTEPSPPWFRRLSSAVRND